MKHVFLVTETGECSTHLFLIQSPEFVSQGLRLPDLLAFAHGAQHP